MANYYTSSFGWTLNALEPQRVALIGGPQGCTLARLEISATNLPLPSTNPTVAIVNLGYAGPGTGATGTIATCPMRNNTVAMSKVVYGPTGIGADPNLPAADNNNLTTWYMNYSGYSLDFPGDGIWVPPGSALHLYSASAQTATGIAFNYNMYFWE